MQNISNCIKVGSSGYWDKPIATFVGPQDTYFCRNYGTTLPSSRLLEKRTQAPSSRLLEKRIIRRTIPVNYLPCTVSQTLIQYATFALHAYMCQVIPGLNSTRRRNSARTFSFFFLPPYYLSIHMLSGMKYVWRSGPIFISYRPGSEHGGNSKEKRSNQIRRFL